MKSIYSSCTFQISTCLIYFKTALCPRCLNFEINKTQGFRVELQVSGRGVTGKGQDRDETGTRQGQDRDKTGTRQRQDRDKTLL